MNSIERWSTAGATTALAVPPVLSNEYTWYVLPHSPQTTRWLCAVPYVWYCWCFTFSEETLQVLRIPAACQCSIPLISRILALFGVSHCGYYLYLPQACCGLILQGKVLPEIAVIRAGTAGTGSTLEYCAAVTNRCFRRYPPTPSTSFSTKLSQK